LNISIADLLQQLQSDTSFSSGWGIACIRRLRDSSACFKGVGLDTIPALLLLTNYIAEVGDRAQQCMNAAGVGLQDAAQARARFECLALLQEGDGLLQLSGLPVMLKLLEGQRLQQLVGGLQRVKQLLSATYCSGSRG
jgi:hypothetical protein